MKYNHVEMNEIQRKLASTQQKSTIHGWISLLIIGKEKGNFSNVARRECQRLLPMVDVKSNTNLPCSPKMTPTRVFLSAGVAAGGEPLLFEDEENEVELVTGGFEELEEECVEDDEGVSGCFCTKRGEISGTDFGLEGLVNDEEEEVL